MNASARPLGFITALAAAFLAFAYGFADDPLGPNAMALPCNYCTCIEVFYWWNNGDGTTQQCRYNDDGFLTTFALVNAYSPNCSTGQYTASGTAQKNYPSNTQQTCTGAASGCSEKLVALPNNQDTPVDLFPTRFICQQ